MAKKIVSIIGACDKRVLCLPLADMLSEYGSVLLVSDNPLYKYLNKEYEAEYMMNGGSVSVSYQANTSEVTERILNDYDIVVFDTFLFVHPDSTNFAMVLDQYGVPFEPKLPKKAKFLRFRYAADKKKIKDVFHIQKGPADEVLFLRTSGKPDAIYAFAAMVMADIYERPPKEMLQELMEGESI